MEMTYGRHFTDRPDVFSLHSVHFYIVFDTSSFWHGTCAPGSIFWGPVFWFYLLLLHYLSASSSIDSFMFAFQL
jgi:hypothetical protein